MRSDLGQVLSLSLLFLIAAMGFAGFQGHRAYQGLKKVEHQRKADSLAMIAINEQARALNAIAAYNEGLEIIIERTRWYGMAIAIVGTCALFEPPPPYYRPCTFTIARLAIQAPLFLRKIAKLGELISEQQDQIKTWADSAPKRVVHRFNMESFYKRYVTGSEPSHDLFYAFLSPLETSTEADVTAALPVHRANGNDNLLADIQDCKEKPNAFGNYQAALQWYRTQYRADRHRLDIYYAHGSDQMQLSPQEAFPKTIPQGRPTIWRTEKLWTFRRIDIRGCSTVNQSISSSVIVPLPAPYVLTTIDHHLTIGLMSIPYAGMFDNVRHPARWFYKKQHPNSFKLPFEKAALTLAEARIEGTKFNELNFEPRLAAISAEENRWNAIDSDSRKIGIYIPALEVPEFEIPEIDLSSTDFSGIDMSWLEELRNFLPTSETYRDQITH